MKKKILAMMVSFFVGVTAISTATLASDGAEVKQHNEVMETTTETEHESETIWDASKDSYSYCFKENYHFGDYQLGEDYLTDEFISQNAISELDVTHAETDRNQPIAVETWQEHAAESFSGGDGTTENPYRINSAEELALLAKKVNAYDTNYSSACYVLINDIDLNKYEWMPIGNGTKTFSDSSDNNFFFGTFNGNGFHIKNLHIEKDLGIWYYGLFGGSSGNIRNTVLENPKIHIESIDEGWQAANGMGTEICVGSIAGQQLDWGFNKNPEIDDCIVLDADIEFRTLMSISCGAAIGGLNYATIKNTKATGRVAGTAERAICIGGFVGKVNNETNVESCCFTGTVSSKNNGIITEFEDLDKEYSYLHYLGGFVGNAGCANSDITMKNCYAKAHISGISEASVEAGGFAGIKEIVYGKANYQNLYCDSTVSVEDKYGSRQSSDFISNNVISLCKEFADAVVVENCFYKDGNKINVFKLEDGDSALRITEDSSYEIDSLDIKNFMINILKLNTDIWNISNTELPILSMENSHIASGQHAFDEIYTIDKEVSCLYEGRKSRHCKECDVVTDIVTIIPTGHEWDEGIIFRESDYTNPGIKIYTCSICKGKRTESIAQLILKQPELLTALNGTKGISVKWKKVAGATGYFVYRKSGNGAWRKIAKVKGETNYIDKKVKNGSSYVYTVAAYNGKNISSYNTKGKMVTWITAPKILKLKNQREKSFTIKWMKNAKANGYQIQYAVSPKFNGAEVVKVSGRTTSKTVKNLSKSKKYYIRVRSYKTSGKTRYYSAWSNVKKIKIK